MFWNINKKVFLDKNRTMDNVQKHNIWADILFYIKSLMMSEAVIIKVNFNSVSNRIVHNFMMLPMN
jgi:hypothetical protein